MRTKHVHRSRFVLFLCFALCLCALSVQAQSSGTTARRHTVQQGETLYRLATRNGVTQEAIVALNPGLTAENLRAGMDIWLPAASSARSNSAATRHHVVKKKETLWSIAQSYGISLEQLTAANPAMQVAGYKLRASDTINIPTTAQASAAASPAANGYSQIRLGVILPFKAKGGEAARCIEFYRGLLLAAEDMKNVGRNITISAFNEPQGHAGMDSIYNVLRERDVQLVIGPLYPDHFTSVSNFCAENKVKCFVPFSSKVSQTDPRTELFLMNAPDEYKTIFAAQVLAAAFTPRQLKVVFLPTEKETERSFCAGLSAMLTQKGYSVTTLPEAYTTETLRGACSTDRLTLFVPNSSERAAAVKVLADLSALRAAQPAAQTALLAYPEWLGMASEYQNDFFASNTYFFSNHYTNVYDDATKQFEQRYKSWFHAPMLTVSPRMALLGYDAGRYLMEGLARYGAALGGQHISVPHLQSDIHFTPSETDSRHINDCMQLIHYRTDRGIEKIAKP